MRFTTTPIPRIALLMALLLLAGSDLVRAGDPHPLSIQPPTSRFPTSRSDAESRAPVSSTSSWWLLPLGLVLAAGAWGGISLSTRKNLPARKSPASLELLGRVSVGPRQSVCLVRVADQVLILGTGPQGPPTLLGELAEPDRKPEEPPR